MPLVFTPILLVLMLVFGHISQQNYIGESHWLLWLRPGDHRLCRARLRQLAISGADWMSLSAGGSPLRWCGSAPSGWRDCLRCPMKFSAAGRPFGHHAVCARGGETPRRTAGSGRCFVVVTASSGWRLAICSFAAFDSGRNGERGGFGAASRRGHGTLVKRAAGGVVASLVMMLSGVVMVLIAPLVAWVKSIPRSGDRGRGEINVRGLAQRQSRSGSG